MASHSFPATQNALVQTAYAQPLELKTVATPELTPGSAIIQIIAAPVISYSKQVYDGTRQYRYPTPLIPGTSAIGRVAALGVDSTALKIGQLIYVDCVIRSRDDPSHIFLLGLTRGQTDGSGKLMSEAWRNGTYSEYCHVPLEVVFPLNEEKLVKELGYKESDLASICKYIVVYGGLRDIGVQVGETVVIAPATGSFGGAAVKVSLAMGASVIAMGRNEAALDGLVEVSGGKVKTVKITQDANKDAEELKKAAGGPIDAVFEISPPMAAGSTHIKSCILALKQGGRMSLMGGIKDDVPIPLMHVMHKDLKLMGKWMYGRIEIEALIKLVELEILKIGEKGGVKNLGEFEFADWKKAFDVAGDNARWDAQVTMKPSRA